MGGSTYEQTGELELHTPGSTPNEMSRLELDAEEGEREHV
jgi:hypothetical protein